MINAKYLTEYDIINAAKKEERCIHRLIGEMHEYLERYFTEGKTLMELGEEERYKRNQEEEVLKEKYRETKNNLKKEFFRLKSHCRSVPDVSEKHMAYKKGMEECIKYGFRIKTGNKITFKMESNLNDGVFRLTTYLSEFKEWN